MTRSPADDAHPPICLTLLRELRAAPVVAVAGPNGLTDGPPPPALPKRHAAELGAAFDLGALLDGPH